MGDRIPRTAWNEYNYGDRDLWYAGLRTWNQPKPPSKVFLDCDRLLLTPPGEENREQEEFEKLMSQMTRESLMEIINGITARGRELMAGIEAGHGDTVQ